MHAPRSMPPIHVYPIAWEIVQTAIKLAKLDLILNQVMVIMRSEPDAQSPCMIIPEVTVPMKLANKMVVTLVRVTPKSTGSNSVIRCFICNSTKHRVNQCPGKSKEEISAAYDKFCEHMKSSRSTTSSTSNTTIKKKKESLYKKSNNYAPRSIQQSSAAVNSGDSNTTIRFSSSPTSDNNSSDDDLFRDNSSDDDIPLENEPAVHVQFH
jgi:hypothetical protein